ERVETLDQQVVLGEARHRVVAHEAGDGPGREAGVEEDDRVGGADEPAGDGDLDPLARELAVEEPRALKAQEAVLQRVQRLDCHAAHSSITCQTVGSGVPSSTTLPATREPAVRGRRVRETPRSYGSRKAHPTPTVSTIGLECRAWTSS